MRVVWSPRALEDLLSIRRFIERENPTAAVHVVATIIGFINSRLPTFPEAGRPGRVKGTREALVPKLPYIVPYRAKGDRIDILRVYHAARRWPRAF
jgi:toxin ParE1/3/4